MTVVAGMYQTLNRSAHFVAEKLRLRDGYRRAGVASDRETLVLMLVGYKPDLWPYVMPRFEAALPEDCTVCLVSPGLYREDLAELCRQKGWSYLGTKTNDVALAQNVCLSLHPGARVVVKLDEDMFLLPGTIAALVAYYDKVKADGIVDPGFVAPMIPVNGFSYRPLLQRLGLIDEYEARFGPASVMTTGHPIAIDPAAARWIWERTTPLAETQAKLEAAPVEMLLSPIKFSIGLIVFERAYWEEFRFFRVYRHRLMAGQSTLGGDEQFLARECIDRSRPIVVHPQVVAGHFSFGPQYPGMMELLRERPELFAN